VARTQAPNVALRGVVACVPGDPQPVRDFSSPFGAGEIEKMIAAVGLDAVHRAPPGVTAGDLCAHAAEQLLADLGWERESVGGVILVTQTPDHVLPATACVVHGQLGLPTTAFAFDVNLGCSGYVYGLWLAAQLVAAGGAQRVLLLAGDTVSHLLSPEDQSVALLFGDAGSATAIEYDPHAPPMYFALGTDGQGARDLCVPAGGFRERSTAAAERVGAAGARRAPTDLFMDGLAVFNFTLGRVPELVETVLAESGWARESVDAYLFHQANGFMLGKIARKLKLPPERVPVNIGRYGNTSVASIPLLLGDAVAGAVTGPAPVRLVLAGFGVGLSWAGAAVTASGLGTARVVSL
jgi:3-oxoacyl-[acyl-carrier-protein] synthase-3